MGRSLERYAFQSAGSQTTAWKSLSTDGSKIIQMSESHPSPDQCLRRHSGRCILFDPAIKTCGFASLSDVKREHRKHPGVSVYWPAQAASRPCVPETSSHRTPSLCEFPVPTSLSQVPCPQFAVPSSLPPSSLPQFPAPSFQFPAPQFPAPVPCPQVPVPSSLSQVPCLQFAAPGSLPKFPVPVPCPLLNVGVPAQASEKERNC